MRRHGMIVTNCVRDQLGPHFTRLYAEFRKTLSFEGTSEYKKNVDKYDTIITWGFKLPKSWYDQKIKQGKTFLYLENGLLYQKHGVYSDTEGWFGNSSVPRTLSLPTEEEILRLASHVQSCYGIELGSHRNTDGPIIFAVQYDRDMGAKWFYPDDLTKTPFHSAMRRLYAEHWNDEVLVRPHPKFLTEFVSKWRSVCKGPKWKVDSSTNVYKTLMDCRELITVNSTLFTEGLAIGIPVNAYGIGAWNGLTFPRDTVPYLCAVLRNQISYKIAYKDFVKIPTIQKWVSKIKE